MRTDYLDSFVKVVELRSLAEAARRLDLTAGAVAARVRALEADLGVELVQRSGHTVVPTEAGLRLVEQARTLLRHARDLRAIAATGNLEGELKLGVFPSALSTHLPILMEAFCRSLPKLSTYVQFGVSDDLCRAVQHGDLDAALVIEPPFAIAKNCGWQTLQDEPLIAIAPLGLPRQDVHEMLSTYPFIRYARSAHSGKLVDRYLKQHGLVPRQRIEVDNLLTIVSLVERGVGVAIVPDSFSIWYQRRSLVHLPLPHRTPIRRIGLVWTLNAPRTDLAEALLAQATIVFGQH